MNAQRFERQFNPERANDPGEYAKNCLLRAQVELLGGDPLEADIWAARTLDMVSRARWNTVTMDSLNATAARAKYLMVLAHTISSRNSDGAQLTARALLAGFDLKLVHRTEIPPLDPSYGIKVMWHDYSMPQRRFILKLSKTPWWLMFLRRRYLEKHLCELVR